MQEKNKSYPILIIGAFTVVLFVAMTTYICVYAITNHRVMMDNSYNAHQQLLKKKNTRGDIYAADGQLLATTKTDEQGNETREYPFGKVFSHVIGFSVNGRSGIENLANYYLINSNATLKSKVEAKENEDSQQTSFEVEKTDGSKKGLDSKKNSCCCCLII